MAEKARQDWETFRQIEARLALHLGQPVCGLRILDIGCGQRYQLTVLFQAWGNRVTGMDTDYILPLRRDSLGTYWQLVGHDGPERTLKTLVRRRLGRDARYFQHLSRLAGLDLHPAQADIRCMSVCALDFADASLDVVVSINTFEHIVDVPNAAQELWRVLRPGGLAYLDIHLFPGLSGGHQPEWGAPWQHIKRRIHPWDHLRRNLYPPNVFLNRLKKQDYLGVFERLFDILEVETVTEGREYLTDEILLEVQPYYGRDDLLTRSLILVLRRPVQAVNPNAMLHQVERRSG